MWQLLEALFNLEEGTASIKKYVVSGEMTQEIADELIDRDPTKTKKYVGWMGRTFVEEGMKPEDVSKFDIVAKYAVLADKGLANNNIEMFKSFEQFQKEVAEASKKKTGTEQRKEAKMAGAKIVVSNDKATVYELSEPPESYEANKAHKGSPQAYPIATKASQLLGKGTRWCISYTDKGTPNQFWKYYEEPNNIYIVIPKPEMEEKLVAEHGKNYNKLAILKNMQGRVTIYDAADQSHTVDAKHTKILQELGVE